MKPNPVVGLTLLVFIVITLTSISSHFGPISSTKDRDLE